MQKLRVLAIMLVGLLAISSANTAAPVQDYSDIKLATIIKMYEQDAINQGMDYPMVLQQYGSSELQTAFQLEQAYFDREQMSCNIDSDVLWDSQDPDYAQDKQFAVTELGLVKVSLAQGSDIYYKLSCTEVACKIDDVILDASLYESETLKDYLINNCV